MVWKLAGCGGKPLEKTAILPETGDLP